MEGGVRLAEDHGYAGCIGLIAQAIEHVALFVIRTYAKPPQRRLSASPYSVCLRRFALLEHFCVSPIDFVYLSSGQKISQTGL